LDVSFETVRRWFKKFGQPIANNLRHSRPTPSDHWYLDEMVVVIRGKKYWLWRAVDNEGEVLDFLGQPRRNAKAAIKSPGSAQYFLNSQTATYNNFYLQPHLLNRTRLKHYRA
ncbi:MAG: IS6 family transposase, partial [Rhodospirillaceae bacterium]|nr:IS6 family transposase [Rhodospirillaceae bacterium]